MMIQYAVFRALQADSVVRTMSKWLQFRVGFEFRSSRSNGISFIRPSMYLRMHGLAAILHLHWEPTCGDAVASLTSVCLFMVIGRTRSVWCTFVHHMLSDHFSIVRVHTAYALRFSHAVIVQTGLPSRKGLSEDLIHLVSHKSPRSRRNICSPFNEPAVPLPRPLNQVSKFSTPTVPNYALRAAHLCPQACCSSPVEAKTRALLVEVPKPLCCQFVPPRLVTGLVWMPRPISCRTWALG